MKSNAKSPNQISVLLIDDHPVVRDGYRRLLENSPDIRVIAEAGDGETGYALYLECKPDVIILDLSMPGIGGLETIRRITSRDDMARVLVFSMHDSEVLMQRAIEMGATGYLTKQSGMGEMVSAVRHVAKGMLFVEQKFALCLTGMRSGHMDLLKNLSPREFQLFQLLAEGRSTTEAAAALSISPGTAGVHHAHIMKKLNIKNDAQLTLLAIQCGITQS